MVGIMRAVPSASLRMMWTPQIPCSTRTGTSPPSRSHRAAARVKISVQPDVFSRKLADLSPGVALEAGHLHITFSGTEDLLGKLFELSQAASNDFDRFRTAAEPIEPHSA